MTPLSAMIGAAFQTVLHLPDVAGPIVLHHQADRGIGHLQRPTLSLRDPAGEEPGDVGEILRFAPRSGGI